MSSSQLDCKLQVTCFLQRASMWQLLNNFLLIDWWWANRLVFQGSCAQPGVTILHLRGGPRSAEELKDIVVLIFWVGTRTLPQGCTTIWLFLLCLYISSLPWLVTVWIYPLELREDQGGWIKPISYRQEMEYTEEICTPESHRVLHGFSSGN